MLKLKPRNKNAWVKLIDAENKIGMLYTPAGSSSQFRLAKIMGLDEECHEAQGFSVGDTVLVDTVGLFTHRIGKQNFDTCHIRNFVALVCDDNPVQGDFATDLAALAARTFNDGGK